MTRMVRPPRRLATRPTKEQHARRRGPLDFRRTARASTSTGGVPVLADLARKTRPAWWLPEHRRQRGIGDSGANRYAEVISMVEGRSLAQLSSFVHDIV